MTVETARLSLIRGDLPLLDAIAGGQAELARFLGATVPEGFPVFPEGTAYWQARLREDPSLEGWASWLFLERGERVVVGDGGFKGPPDEEGGVEIGYAIVPGYRGRGYATEAARGLIERAFARPEVALVRAETLAAGAASMRVLAKLGMRQVGTGVDPDEGPIVRWAVRRAEYPGGH